jgi:hypothetical protein
MRGEISMQILPLRSAAIRMAILFCLVCALDIAAVFLTAKPRLWCALIPTLIPIFTPAVIFSHRANAKN